MGKRHLVGLLKAGFEVVGRDPRRESRDSAMSTAATTGFPEAFRCDQDEPEGEFEVAVFAETAPYRLRNLEDFLEKATSKKLLIEKPLTADPTELPHYRELFRSHGLEPRDVSVNLSRRTWPFFVRLKTFCGDSPEIMVTANGGAVGFGSNGIHFLDLFLYLTGEADHEVEYARLSTTSIGSGRGPEFSDFGGTFLIGNGRSSLFCSLSAESSAPPLFVLRGDHFIASFDEFDLGYRLASRHPESRNPNYLCGRDYSIVDQGTMGILPFEQVTARWADGTLVLPDFEDAFAAHQLLFSILEAAGRAPPYAFT